MGNSARGKDGYWETAEPKERTVPAEVLLPDGRMGYECRNCGNELSVDSFNGCYCHWCGKKLRWEVPEDGRNNANHNYQRTVEI